ncbi:unnamed protein product [Rotaria socialis]
MNRNAENERIIVLGTDERIFILATALHQGYTIDRLFQLTKIDRWFLHKYASIIQFIRQHSDSSITQDPLLLLQAKRLGFSDKQISKYSNCTEIEVRACREEFHIRPFLKQIDNVFGERSPKTDYLYFTYESKKDDFQLNSQRSPSIFYND